MNREQRRKRFDGGRSTPEEFHARHAFKPGSKCRGCGRPPMHRISVFIPKDELRRRDPDFALWEQIDPGGVAALTVQLKHGYHIRTSMVDVCDACLPTAERAAAKSPSWAVVNIQRAPRGVMMVGGGSALPT